MSKRIELEDGFYRERRGKPAKIPDEWVGETTHPQTQRKRASKSRALKLGRQRNLLKDGSADWSNYRGWRHDSILRELDD